MDSEDEPLWRPQSPEFDTSEAAGIDTLDDLHQAETNRGKRRIATVYDAVAGRLSHHHDLSRGGEGGSRPSSIAKHSLREAKYGPDEVLFRRKDAPARYAEHDVYYAHERDLPHGGRGVLPESDLLKAVHGYAGRMDETALLAFGILLEEAGRDVLGKRGDMVFTEGIKPEDTTASSQNPRNKQILTGTVGSLDGIPRPSQVKRRSKRRRVGSPRQAES
ncbi:hypothetical protein LLEC1_07889 [Akanthomyces lecanii]|uniref:Uncharacterized protein n=1 Tax=Cordyceps confragosa TaxID=2714763 RepID=A0A179IDX2_CORDF|nr:hypothetical protein LLEC1_07889 [Akanthomyces lecanii]